MGDASCVVVQSIGPKPLVLDFQDLDSALRYLILSPGALNYLFRPDCRNAEYYLPV